MSKKNFAENSGKQSKKKPRGRPFQKGKDERRNTEGAPRKGMSWKELIAEYGDMSGPEIAARWDTQAKEFSKLPANVALKDLIVIQAYASLLHDFSANTWDKMMERTDGKVTQPIEHAWKEEARKRGIDPDELVKELFGELASVGAGSGDTGSVGAEEKNAVEQPK